MVGRRMRLSVSGLSSPVWVTVVAGLVAPEVGLY